MNPAEATPPAALLFPVTYQSGVVYNRDLAGAGTLALHDDAFVFTGKRRRMFASRQPAEMVLHRDQIRGVTRVGNAVQFTTSAGRSGKQKEPFVFYCADEAAAERIATLLPDTIDPDQRDAADFGRRLRAVVAQERPGPSITNTIVGLNVAAFIIMGFLGAGWFETASMRPYMLYVANNGAATTDGQWWRLVTCMFAHYGLLHLALNMWALYQVGHLVERLLGRSLYALTYLGSGVLGSLTTLLWHGDKVWSAGASGAVFGIYGALLGFLWREKEAVPRSVLRPLMRSTLIFAAYNLIYGAVQSGIDNSAHIGGLLGGLLLGAICALPLDGAVRARARAGRFLIAAGVVAVAVFAGVAWAPRYNYRVADKLRLNDALLAHGQRERELLKEGDALFAKLGTPAAEQAARHWIKDEMIPLYSTWRQELQALQLDPHRLTAQRRDALVAVFDLKLTMYRDLLAAENWEDPAVVERYANQQKQVSAEIVGLDHLE